MSQEGMIGEVKVFAGNFAPRTWAFCEGQLLAISQYTALFSILGTIYGGDGRTTFALPDLRGRSPISAGTGPGLSKYSEGQRIGVEQVDLSANQIPSHTHGASTTVNANNASGSSSTPGGGVWSGSAEGDNIYGSGSNTTMATDAVEVTVQNTGGGQAHENRPPLLAMRWIICIEGTFPSRN
jgi:microcystin-dependent protein